MAGNPYRILEAFGYQHCLGHLQPSNLSADEKQLMFNELWE